MTETQEAAQRLRDTPHEEPADLPPVTDASVSSGAATDSPIPEPPLWGAREIEVPIDEVYRHIDTHVLFKLHWGGKGVKGEEWQRLVQGDPETGEEGFQPRLERMWQEQTYLHPRALVGYFPCNSDGNELIVWDPAAPRERELERLVFPVSPAMTGSASRTSSAP